LALQVSILCMADHFILAVTVLGVAMLSRSRLGERLVAIRDDELLTESLDYGHIATRCRVHHLCSLAGVPVYSIYQQSAIEPAVFGIFPARTPPRRSSRRRRCSVWAITGAIFIIFSRMFSTSLLRSIRLSTGNSRFDDRSAPMGIGGSLRHATGRSAEASRSDAHGQHERNLGSSRVVL